jgi:hypothetical protein
MDAEFIMLNLFPAAKLHPKCFPWGSMVCAEDSNEYWTCRPEDYTADHWNARMHSFTGKTPGSHETT